LTAVASRLARIEGRARAGGRWFVVVQEKDHAACMVLLRAQSGLNVDRLFIVVTEVDMSHDDGPKEWLAMARGGPK
jgi:hypothetical protein